MSNFSEIEKNILYKRYTEPTYVDDVIAQLMNYKRQLDYNCHRFIDQYGPKVDSETPTKYTKFLKNQNEEYSSITRLLRVIAAYEK